MSDSVGIKGPASDGVKMPVASSRRYLCVAFYALLAVLALLPLLVTTVPPLVDYPNHLARAHILATFETNPLLQQNYAIEWSVRPNLGIDLTLPYLSKVIGPYAAGHVFLAVTLLLLVAGTLFLRYVLLGSIGFAPAILFLFLYNQVLYWGFVNYLFGAGLFFVSYSL